MTDSTAVRPIVFTLSLFIIATSSISHAATPLSGITTFGTGTSALIQGAANGAGLAVTDVFGYDIKLVTGTADATGIYLGDLAHGSGSGILYYPDSVAVIPLVSYSMSSNGGEFFDLRSLEVSLTDMVATSPSTTLVLTGYVDGLAKPGAVLERTLNLTDSATPNLELFDVSTNAAFVGIDEFRLTPAAGSAVGYLGVDNVNAVNFTLIPEPSALLLGAASFVGLVLRRRVIR